MRNNRTTKRRKIKKIRKRKQITRKRLYLADNYNQIRRRTVKHGRVQRNERLTRKGGGKKWNLLWGKPADKPTSDTNSETASETASGSSTPTISSSPSSSPRHKFGLTDEEIQEIKDLNMLNTPATANEVIAMEKKIKQIEAIKQQICTKSNNAALTDMGIIFVNYLTALRKHQTNLRALITMYAKEILKNDEKNRENNNNDNDIDKIDKINAEAYQKIILLLDHDEISINNLLDTEDGNTLLNTELLLDHDKISINYLLDTEDGNTVFKKWYVEKLQIISRYEKLIAGFLSQLKDFSECIDIFLNVVRSQKFVPIPKKPQASQRSRLNIADVSKIAEAIKLEIRLGLNTADPAPLSGSSKGMPPSHRRPPT